MKRKQLPKVRNPFVLHAKKRIAGAHVKPYKVSRRDFKVEIKKDYSNKIVYPLFLSSLLRP